MTCPECSKSYLMRCPACNGTMRVVIEGLWCPDCGYLKRTVSVHNAGDRTPSEQTLAMTEIRKVGERK